MYKTVPCAASAEFVERRSRFLGYIRPVTTQEAADAFVEEIRSMHRTATHHVYAYVLREGQFQRYSDDGEPQGTAGIPVLNVLLKNGVTDTAVVVVRYFGGVLLGAGGLVRAYSAGAAAALREAGIVAMTPCTEFTLSCSYNQYGRVSALVPECGGVIEHTDFAGDVTLRCYLRPGAFPHFQRTLADATNGHVSPVVFGEKFVAFPVEAENN